MTIYFDHPEYLLIALLAVPLVIVGWLTMRNMDLLRKVLSLGLRAVLLAGLSVMLASPHIAREHHRVTVIGLLDISTSVRRFAELPAETEPGSQSYVDYLRQWFRAATNIKADDDRFGLIVFDGRAAAISTPTARQHFDDTIGVQMVEGTNIAEAIQLGLAMFPADTARRLVLVSDGNETLGSAVEAAKQAAGAAGASFEFVDAANLQATVPIDVLPIAYNVRNDVQVVRVEAPAQAQASQTITVRIVLEATQPTTGRLALRHEGRFVDLNGAAPGFARAVQLPAGRSVHRAQVQLQDSKVNRFEAVFEPDEPGADMLADNNQAEAFTATPAEGKVLIVEAESPTQANVLAETLRDADFALEVRQPMELPDDLLSLQRYDLIVLDNIPAYALTTHQQKLVSRYVNDLGGGLIMLGGENSFGAGGWNNTPIEDVLPLELNPPRELRLAEAALVLVLDKSGSMNRPVAGARASQQQVANEGAALAVESLRETSYVGVVTFDLFAYEHVELQRNDNPREIANRIRAIRADGGTNLKPALRMARDMLNSVDVEKKRVVCLTDGQSETEGLDLLVKDMFDDGIRLTTIAVGDDADDVTLRQLADLGGGEFYLVRNPKILPAVLIDSVQIINKPLIREGLFEPQVQPTGSSLTASMTAAPPLGGLVITSPKPQPTVIMEMTHPEGEPLLARWQAGLGKVAAFTSSAHPPWAERWQDWPEAATFWTQLARQTSRPKMDRETELTTRIDDDQLVIQLDVLDPDRLQEDSGSAGVRASLDYLTIDGTVYRPDGSSQQVRLRQTGPRRYEASVPAEAAGNYIVALTPKRSGAPLAPVIGGTSRTGSPELRRYSSNIELLRDVAQLTGGRVLDVENPRAVNVFDRSELPKSRSILPVWRTILLMTIALMLLDVANRRIAWSTAGVVNAARRVVGRAKAAQARSREIATAVGSLRQTGPAAQRPKRDPHAPKASTGPAKQTGPAEINFRTAPQEQEPDRKEPPKPKKPDRRKVEAALDELLGRAKPTGESPPPEPPREEADDDKPSSTSSLLEARRRARQQREQQDES